MNKQGKVNNIILSWTKKTSKQYRKVYIESYFAEKKVSNVSAIIADDNTITDPIKIAKMSIASLHQ